MITSENFILKGVVLYLALCLCLLIMSGCLTELKDKQVHVSASGWGGRTIPQAGLLEIGYIDGCVDTFPVKAGQGGLARTRQYSTYWSTNLTFESLVVVLPYVDSNVSIQQQHDAILSVLGVSIPNPVGPRREVITVTPAKAVTP